MRSFDSHTLYNGPWKQIRELPQPQTIRALKRIDLPDKKGWIDRVNAALQAIKKGEISKVVLAREVLLELPFAPNPLSITAALQTKNRGAVVFCVIDKNSGFLGATPEPLFFRRQNQIECIALAGTRLPHIPFGTKERSEFDPVQTFLQQTLSPFCLKPVTFSPVLVHQTHHLAHLTSRCYGQLRNDISDEEIIARLHPTPALSGTPQTEARSWISQHEPFSRGFYGGILGWKSKDLSEYRVLIRCCKIEGNFARLYSGAGIVAGSDPEAEWEELEQKIKLYEGILY